MSKLHPYFDSFRSDAHINLNKALMFAIGNNEAMVYAELLSRRVYFEERDQLDPDGYFYNIVEDLWTGVNLNDHYQRMAIKNLKDLGLINVQVRGIPAKRYFKIVNNPELLISLVHKGKEIIKNGMKNARKSTENHSFENGEELVFNGIEGNNNNNNAHTFDVAFMTEVGQALKDAKKPWKYRKRPSTA